MKRGNVRRLIMVAACFSVTWSCPVTAQNLDLHAAYCLGRLLGLERLTVTPDQSAAMQEAERTVNRKTDHAVEAYQAYLMPRGVTSVVTAAIAHGRADAARRKETIDQCLAQGVGPAGLASCIGDDNSVQNECLQAVFLPF